MKSSTRFRFVAAGLAGAAFSVSAAWAGPMMSGKAPVEIPEIAPTGGFDRAIRPLTNPVLFDLAVPRTQIHPLFLWQNLPSSVNTILGDLPVGGDFQVYALQFEYAFNERLSLVAVKDGYIDFNPDNTLSDADGWANLGAGLKWAFLYQPENELAASLTLTYEIPIGDTDVWQGTGDGIFTPSLSAVKLWDRFQFAGVAGFQLPIDTDANSTEFYTSAHVSYETCRWFIPTVEVNWFHVLDSGDGGSRFGKQVGGAVPAVVRFEGGDLVNLGASNAGDESDLVTLGLGFRTRVTESIDFGFAYELPLTDDKDGLMEDRFTVDLVWKF